MVGRGVTAGGRLAFAAGGSDRGRTNLSLAPRALSPRQSAVVYTVRGFDKFLGILNHLNPEISLSCLLSTHPLQVRAGRNQLQPLLVTMTDGELLHAWGLSSTCRAAPRHARTACEAARHLGRQPLALAITAGELLPASAPRPPPPSA